MPRGFLIEDAEMREPTKTVVFGDYELDLGCGELRHREKPVDIQPTPLRVLLYLAEHRDRTVPRRELLDAIWPGVVVGDEALTTALSEARHAVGDDGASQRVIRTHKGRGVRFVAKLSEAAPPRRGARVGLAAAAVAALLAGTGLSIALLRSRGEAPTAPAPYGVVVLPLSNLTGDARDQALANGLTEQLTQMLAIGGFPVVARTTAAQWKEHGTDVRELRNALGVSHAFEGGVQRARDRVRVTIQLVATGTGQSLWSETFEHPDGDAFAIQDQITARVSAKAFQYVLAEDIVRWNPEYSELHRRFVETFAAFHQGRFEDHLLAGEQLLRDLPEGESTAGLRAFIHGMMGQAWRNIWLGAPQRWPEASTKLLAHAKAAVALDSGSAFSHHILANAFVAHRRWEEAEREMRRACEIAPRDGMSCGSTQWVVCIATGCADALSGAQRWREQFPGQAASWASLGMVLSDAGRLEEAEGAELRARGIEEAWGVYLPHVQWELGKRAEAVESLLRFARATDAKEFAREIERAAAQGPEAAWRRAADLAVGDEAHELRAFGPINNPACHAGRMYLQLGEHDLALDALERAVATREPCIETTAVPYLDAIRDTPRFRALVAAAGLTPFHEKYGVFERARQRVAASVPNKEPAR